MSARSGTWSSHDAVLPSLTAGTPVMDRAGPGADAQGSARRLLVELVGPAGAGKTALLRALNRRDRSILPGLPVPRLRLLPSMLHQIVLLAPAGLELLRLPRRVRTVSARHLLRARTHGRILIREPRASAQTIIVDEGPIYSLCCVLLALGSGDGPALAVPRAWRTSLERWGRALDLVVWVDGPDDVLTERIRQRTKEHRVKECTDPDVHAFLRQFRTAYRDILAQLSAAGGPPVIELDSNRQSTEQLVDAVLPALARVRQARGSLGKREA